MLGERNIKLEGGAGLFHYAVLNCFANFKTSHRRFSGVNYTIYPGEWLCTIDELISLLRVRNRNQALEILYDLEERNLISFNLLSAGDCVKYRIKGWSVFNRTYDYHAPCHKDTGFFYIPISLTNEIVGTRTASEADSEQYYTAYYKNEYCFNHYTIYVEEVELSLSVLFAEQMLPVCLGMKYREDVAEQIKPWEITEAARRTSVNDPNLYAMVASLLDKNERYQEEYAEVIAEVAHKLTSEHTRIEQMLKEAKKTGKI